MNTTHTKTDLPAQPVTAGLAFTFLIAVIAGCGGGSGGVSSSQASSGRFIDSPVDGLDYNSASRSGTTTGSGEFFYIRGERIDFSVGAVALGSAPGASVITPVDLLSKGNTSDNAVQNIARFLLMLDSDNDSNNGITISNNVQRIADTWAPIDFTTGDLNSALINIQSDIASVDSRLPVLPDAMTAKAHLESSLSCLASGVFAGSYSGDDNGRYLLWIQSQRFDPATFGDAVPRIGVTSALVYSTDDNQLFGVAPRQGLSFDAGRGFISGVVSTGAHFSGNLRDFSAIENGLWQNTALSESGVFNGSRQGGSLDARYRISAFFNQSPAGTPFSIDGSGLLALDVFDDSTVVGVIATLRGNQRRLSGTLNNDVIVVAANGMRFTLHFDADGTDAGNDPQLGGTPGVVGTGVYEGRTVDVIGSSCILN